LLSEAAQADENQKSGRTERSAILGGECVQMEGLAQRIQGLACDLCPGKPLVKKSVLQAAFLQLQQKGILQIKVNAVSLGSTCLKVHPAGMDALEKEGSSLSAEPGADGIPNFIWSPQLIGMG